MTTSIGTTWLYLLWKLELLHRPLEHRDHVGETVGCYHPLGVRRNTRRLDCVHLARKYKYHSYF